jgi:hypothetical protein
VSGRAKAKTGVPLRDDASPLPEVPWLRQIATTRPSVSTACGAETPRRAGPGSLIRAARRAIYAT